MGLIIERIPHKTVAYAFLEVQGDNANEFESLRNEALKRAPHYGFAANAPAEPTKKSAPVEKATTEPEPGAEAGAGVAAGEEDASVPAQTQEAEQASAPAPTSEGLSPREKAKAAIAAKKGA